jgi:alanyl-tRNA synthetase
MSSHIISPNHASYGSIGMKKSGSQIRQEFLEFFKDRGHTCIPSASLVPGGDQTLLFTNAGMVQFKDVFLGTDKRPYTRAVDAQKCLRVAGKHNDLDEVGRDDFHHTFFEMLGNWSFGDYYKKEAITWAWELLTLQWKLDKTKLYVTCFQDEKGRIPTDEEAAENWRNQPGIIPDHVLFFGRKDNFWEMAETGPCGPCSEIHIDRGEDACDKRKIPGHVCSVNGDCKRFMEIWNLVFIQYNRISQETLQPLPSKHIDTGMGFERIVSILQGVDSNYKTDLLSPLMDAVQKIAGTSSKDRVDCPTPYRVIADHARSAAFLIADGVVPGNIGRNYVCRMIIRRAARFGTKLGLTKPFLAQIAEEVIHIYGDFYPELKKNQKSITENLHREEIRFSKTLEGGLAKLEELMELSKTSGVKILDGKEIFELYATHGLPLEVTRDITGEQGLAVDEKAFEIALEEHRKNSSTIKEDEMKEDGIVETYQTLVDQLVNKKSIPTMGVEYAPYDSFRVSGKILAIIKDNRPVLEATSGDEIGVILPKSCFYIESGGQVSDTGIIKGQNSATWTVQITEVEKPVAGLIVHKGKVVKGTIKVGDSAAGEVDRNRRQDIMRNHTATHLLHAVLRNVLGNHARQSGSLVAPDKLRFDFTHPDALTEEQIIQIENQVNSAIYEGFDLRQVEKPLTDAIGEGAMALFGEKYGEMVKTITIGENPPYSYELCGGTHVHNTSEIGIFLITSESPVSAGNRRIEAITGRKAYELVQKRTRVLLELSMSMHTNVDSVNHKVNEMIDELEIDRKLLAKMKGNAAESDFLSQLDQIEDIKGIKLLRSIVPDANVGILRDLADKFREKIPDGVAIIGSVSEGKPILMVTVSAGLVKKGINAVEIVRFVGKAIGGGGGGKPDLAQAGGKDPAGLQEAMSKVIEYF